MPKCPGCKTEEVAFDGVYCPACREKARKKDPLIGRKVGSVELIRRLGKGGMGVVYLA